MSWFLLSIDLVLSIIFWYYFYCLCVWLYSTKKCSKCRGYGRVGGRK